MLYTEPSFCIYNNTNEGEATENEKEIKNSKGTGSSEFTFAERNMELIVEDDEDDKSSEFKNTKNEENYTKDSEQIEPPNSPKMYLATGFGIDFIGGVEYDPNVYDEEYYKMMVMQDPCNPLFSKNYARLLQSKGDITGAEEYYLRAIKHDPKDGEILMEYGKLIWEQHCDQDRALSYIEKAVIAAPGDSNILAAYASFLWEIEQVQHKDHDQVIKG